MTATSHQHRCRECRDPVPVQCVDAICAEGVRWVIMCLRCWERLVDAAEHPAWP